MKVSAEMLGSFAEMYGSFAEIQGFFENVAAREEEVDISTHHSSRAPTLKCRSLF